MKIREITENDRPDWVRLRDALWPGSLLDHDVETRKHFETRADRPIVFVADAGGRLAGFLELDFRKYAPGCTSSPVPFIEGWLSGAGAAGARRRRALMDAAETYARASGHHEIASDAELSNAGGIAAHGAVGFDEVERTVSFRKSLPSR